MIAMGSSGLKFMFRLIFSFYVFFKKRGLTIGHVDWGPDWGQDAAFNLASVYLSLVCEWQHLDSWFSNQCCCPCTQDGPSFMGTPYLEDIAHVGIMPPSASKVK